MCVCGKVWGSRPQVFQEGGHNSQCLPSSYPFATGIASGAFYINMSAASRFQPFVQKTLTHFNWIPSFEANK